MNNNDLSHLLSFMLMMINKEIIDIEYTISLR